MIPCGEPMSASPVETEIKLRIADARAGSELLERNGFRVVAPRVFESNDIYDTPDLSIRARGCLLRLRSAGERSVLTFKGPAEAGRYKSRPESETDVADPDQMRQILRGLGYAAVFRYEKYRTEYQRPGDPGVATVDETPIGAFLELEGPAEWIDQTAHTLGFGQGDYLTSSYATLWREYRESRDTTNGGMVF
jgi:adenylate cyclase class 2